MTQFRAGLLSVCIGFGAVFTFAPGASARQTVAYEADVPAGTIVISQRERRLYLILGAGQRQARQPGMVAA